MKYFSKFFILTLLPFWFISCVDRTADNEDFTTVWHEKTIAVILPMGDGLDIHWKRCLGMFGTNLERAFKTREEGIRIKFELYDESSPELERDIEAIASRHDIFAVIGGLYSSNAAVMGARLIRSGKTFFTLSTSEQLIRAYASTGDLWAMTETDITQCEVLLSKVVNYGGKSVALIAKEDDLYGNTFLDWYAFQARELGLDNHGVFPYNEANLADMALKAMESGAEYVVCIPSEIEEMGPMLDAGNSPHLQASAPRLLFSDTAYGADVLSIFGEKAEGIEGVTFGADPESGFDISYNTFFHEMPTLGEAQLYDASMLLAYAAWYQHLNPDTPLRSALRTIVTGEDINMGSWTGEDMGLVIDALANGDHPCVRGASGPLNFDSKIFTNVLSTTYYNFKVYNGAYIILDYNTSDGGNRTDATLAGWNWKASLMQEFDNDSGVLTYPELKGNKAVLVASSQGWTNYRHQADVLAIYRLLKDNGFSDDDIILIAEDDIAYNPENPEKGVIRVTPGGRNVYEDVNIDYHLSDLSPADISDILTGHESDRLPVTLQSGPEDNVFFFWSGHGMPGALSWNTQDYGITGPMLRDSFLEMSENGTYRKLLMMVETCYSGSVLGQCDGIPGMLFVTAANGEETSKADIFNSEMKVWMSNRFTSTFIEQISATPDMPLRDLYYRLFINTVGSHVMVYNARNYGNLYSSGIGEFISIPKR